MDGPARLLRRLVRVVISLVLFVFDALRAECDRARGKQASVRIVVLYYHAITAQQRARFARQMDLLLNWAKPFSAATCEWPTTSGRHVAVSFDDAYVSVKENALPVLRERRIPCLVFVPTGSLGKRPQWVGDSTHPYWRERVMTADELKIMATTFAVTLGSHSVTHSKFATLNRETARVEFTSSKAILDSLVEHDVDTFSFPHGAYTSSMLRLAKESGYRRVFTIEPEMYGASEPEGTVGRVAVTPDDWDIEFRLKLAGAYRWQAAIHRVWRGISCG